MLQVKLMTRRYTLAQLEYLVAVADQGSMSAAARDLRVSQSAVSLAILALERQFGAQLFQRRNAKGLVLTVAGRRLTAGARHVLTGAAEFDAQVVADGRGFAGPVRLGCFVPLSPFFLPPVIAHLADSAPDVDVQFSEGSLVELQQDLLEGRTELAITYDMDLLPGINVEPLGGRSRMHLVVAGSHRLAGRRKVRISDLAKESLIVVRIPPTRLDLERQLGELGLVDRVRYTVSSYELACALAGRGLGCAMVGFPPAASVSVDGRPIATAALEMPAPSFTVVLARARGGQPGGRVLLVEEAIRHTATMSVGQS